MSVPFEISHSKRITFTIDAFRSKGAEEISRDLETLAWLLKTLSHAQHVSLKVTSEDLRKMINEVPPQFSKIWFEVRTLEGGGVTPVLGHS